MLRASGAISRDADDGVQNPHLPAALRAGLLSRKVTGEVSGGRDGQEWTTRWA